MDSEWIKVVGAVVGAVTGLTALCWRFIDEFGAFLRISVKAEAPKGGWVTVLTTVENKGSRPKTVTHALLLVGPEAESPIDTVNSLLMSHGKPERLSYTNDFKSLPKDGSLITQERAVVPIPFYYSENVSIADETLTYRVPLDPVWFLPAKPYSVRFFLFADQRLHRSTHDVFIRASAIGDTIENQARGA